MCTCGMLKLMGAQRIRLRFIAYLGVFLLLATLIFELWKNKTSLHRSTDKNGHVFDVMTLAHDNDRTRDPDTSINSKYLPPEVVKKVKRFLFFVGYARSGHSIIASMLDAHPNVVIAHEYSLFYQWQMEPELHSNKSWLFNTLYENSQYNMRQGLRNKNAKNKGYSLSMPGLWQGKYDKYIDVIGDKAGGMTAQVYRRSHSEFISLYHQLENSLGKLPISVIHVLRNPYDNIATMLLYNQHQKLNASIINKYENDEALTHQIISYFNQVKSVMDMIERTPLKVLELHSVDMISDPKGTLQKACSFLQIHCTATYLHTCAKFTYTSESRSRELVHWTASNIELVAEKSQKFSSLLRYSFTS